MIRLLVLLVSLLVIIADAAVVAFFVLRWDRRIADRTGSDVAASADHAMV